MDKLSFTTLKRNCKKDVSGLPSVSLAILGDCATQHLATAIRGYGIGEGLNIRVFDADYNQIQAQILDEQSEYYTSKSAFTLIFMCVEKLYHTFCESKDRRNFADQVYNEIRQNWKRINMLHKTNIIQMTFVEADDRVYGNYAWKEPESFLWQVRRLNQHLMEGAAEFGNVFLMDLNYLELRFGRQTALDEKLYYLAKMPISTTVLPEAAKQVVDIIRAVSGRIYKCVITDLDNTLWGGVIGDDGLEGIEIGELGLGHAFEELQLWLRELKRRGIILAVCSKNEEAAAREPFLKHPEMILRLEDFAVFMANWDDKGANIRKIRDILNIGMDSIVFLDDNPFEREQVRRAIPEICVPELPEDPAAYVGFLKDQNLFETASHSAMDENRTLQYQAEAQRAASIQHYQSYDDYLQSLHMVAQVRPFDKYQFPRIAQLTQRSNQFNLRTVRCTEAEIEQLAADDRFLTLYFTLEDDFGSHGLISIAILQKTDTETLFVYNWLMSCRVLKRGMEEFIINQIIETAREHGYKKVIGEYLATPKNSMVKDIYTRLGFKPIGDGRFSVDVDQYVKNKTYIKIMMEDEK